MKNAFYEPTDSVFVDNYIKQYLDTPIYKQSVYPAIEKAWDIKYDDSTKIIDLACGTGVQTRMLKKKSGGKVIGIDNSIDMLNVAINKEEKEQLGIKYVLADCYSDITQLPEVSAMIPLDLVNVVWLICNEENFEKIKNLVSTSFKLLRPGGVMVLVTINPKINIAAKKLTKYGITIEEDLEGKEVKDGMIINCVYTINHKFPPLKLPTVLWTTEILHAEFKKVGFSKFEIVERFFITDSKYEAEYYKDYLEGPESVIYKITK